MLVTCFGATSSGKSALLQQLVRVAKDDEDDDQHVLNVPKTISTVGVNQYSVPLKRLEKNEPKYQALRSFCFGPVEDFEERYLRVRELGGAIQPLWASNIKNSLSEKVSMNRPN